MHLLLNLILKVKISKLAPNQDKYSLLRVIGKINKCLLNNAHPSRKLIFSEEDLRVKVSPKNLVIMN
jgi:REP element-mobilizing transposase RayT